MAKDVRIIPVDGDIQFYNAAASASGKIQQVNDDLVISNAVGDILFGDTNSDVYIGDGISNVDIVFEQDGEIRGEAGSNVALTLGSKDTTIYVTGSTVALQKDGGNVGIGTTAPSERLEVRDGNIIVSGSTPRVMFDNPSLSFQHDWFLRNNGGAGQMEYRFGGGAKIYFDNHSIRFGDWGAGTGTNASTQDPRIAKQGFGSGLAGGLQFFTNNTARMSISGSTGYVGIGTATPSQRLHVVGNASVDGYVGNWSSQTRDKLRVWGDGAYTIGMKDGYTFGHLGNDYAMSFQMNQATTRGFWWGHSNNTDAQGAMALTTDGRAVIATSLSIGEGNTVTSPSSETLYVDGDAVITGKVTAQEFHTEFVSASILYSSGSTQFGDTSDDVHTFIGDLNVDGDIYIDNSHAINFSGSNNTNLLEINGNTLIKQISPRGGIQIGRDDAIIIGGGESSAILAGQTNTEAEVVHIGAESGVYLHGLPNNGDWAARTTLNVHENGYVALLTGSATRAKIHTDGDSFFNGGNVGIRTSTPSNTLHVTHFGQDGNNGIVIVRGDSSTVTDDLLGSIGFDSLDGNIPSSNLEASAYIAAYASEDHSTGDKGGYLTFGTAPNDQDDDTVSLERMRILSNGNVGIGNSSPATKLDVSGSVRIKTENPILQLLDDNTTIRYAATQFATAGGNWFISSGDSNTGAGLANSDLWITRAAAGTDNRFRFHRDSYAFTVYSGSSARVSLNAEGNSWFTGGSLGVGTTSPQANLHVADSTSSSTAFKFFVGRDGGNTSQGLGIAVDDSGTYIRATQDETSTEAHHMTFDISSSASGDHYYLWNINDTSRMWLEDTGLGIGTTNPAQKLHVVGNAEIEGNLYVNQYIYHNDDLNTYIQLSSDLIQLYAGGVQMLSATESTLDELVVNEGGALMNFRVESDTQTHAFFVTGSTGNIGIGTNSPNSKTEILETSTNGEGAELRIINDGTAVGTGQTTTITLGRNFDERNIKIKSVSSANYGAKPELVITQNQNDSGTSHTEVLRINNAGNVGIGTATPTSLLHLSSSGGSIKVETQFSGQGNPQLYIEGNKGGSSNAMSTVVELKGNTDARGRGIIYTNADDDKQWFAGVPYNGGAYQIGYDASGNDIPFYAASSSLSILASGNVGIGTPSPQSKLHVSSGDVLISNNQFYLAENSVGTNYKLAGITSGNVIQVGAIDYTTAGTIFAGGDSVRVTTGGAAGSTRIYVSGSGNVGIGTTNPAQKLHVDGNALITGWLNASNYIVTPLFYNSGDHYTLNKAGNGWLNWADRDTSGAETVINLSSIGTLVTTGSVTFSNYGAGFLKTNANGVVSVDSTSYDNYGEWHMAGDADSTDITSGKWVKFVGGASITGTGTEANPYLMDISPSSASYATFAATAGTATTATTATSADEVTITTLTTNGNFDILYEGSTANRISKDAGGDFAYNPSTNVLTVGTVVGNLTGLASSASHAEYADDAGLATNARFVDVNNVTTGTTYRVVFADSSGTGYEQMNVHDNGIEYDPGTATLRLAGDVVAYNSFSDRELKDNVQTYQGGLNAVMQLNPVTYEWKKGREGQEIGLIAQEVEEVVPQVVREQQRMDEGTYKTVDYEKLVAVLIDAVQDQQKQIDELKQKLDGITK